MKIRRITTCGYVQTVVKISYNTENRNLYIARIAGQKWTELVGNSDRLNNKGMIWIEYTANRY